MAERLAPLGYYKWHWQSWRANRKVQRMSYIERGIYRELLDECWAEGFIPDDIEKLADICGCPSEVMANAWQVLSKCFANAGNGFLYNERLEQERTDMDRTRANRARAGAAGGRAKATNGAGSDGNSLANASKCQSNASNSHIEEKRREENKPPNPQGGDGGRKIREDKTPYQEIVAAYREALPHLPQPDDAANWNKTRRGYVKARWDESAKRQSLDWWRRYFNHVAKSAFLTGKTPEQFEATFDWLMKPTNMQKVIEGNYHKVLNHG